MVAHAAVKVQLGQLRAVSEASERQDKEEEAWYEAQVQELDAAAAVAHTPEERAAVEQRRDAWWCVVVRMAAAAAEEEEWQGEARAIRAVEQELVTQDALVAVSAERERKESAVLPAGSRGGAGSRV